MSASDKKRLRKEQAAAQMSERQRQQQKEDKKLKIYTVTFVTALVLIVCLAVGVLVGQSLATSGHAERKTIAATVGDHKINSVEMAYYYSDAINNLYNNLNSYGDGYADYYLEAMGLALNVPLTEQENPDTGDTWANYFLDSALETAQSDYAMYDLAMQDSDFALPEENRQNITTAISNLDAYATLNGYNSGDKYLQAIYGYGADLDSYQKYLERTEIAEVYYNEYYNALSFEDKDIRELEEKNGAEKYNAYTYDYTYVTYSDFLEGGTEDEDGNVTYTDEQNAAARAKAKEAADKLSAAKTAQELEALIKDIKLPEDSTLTVENIVNQIHTSVNTNLISWLSDAKRKAGDKTVLEITADTSEDSEETVVNSYYVVIFQSMTDNTELTDNVRHLLVAYEGGTTDETTGETTYSDEEKATAMTSAKALLEQYQKDPTEDNFIALVKEHSADEASVEAGGLYEDIHYDSQYEEAFLNWAIDPDRKAGDTGIVETPYGCHIMYYAGNSDISYRDLMITDELRTNAINTWFENAQKATPIAKKDLSKLALDVTLSNS